MSFVEKPLLTLICLCVLSANLFNNAYAEDESILVNTSLFFNESTFNESTKEKVDPVLVRALNQATRDETEQSIDLEALVWLSDMANRLEKRIPDPFYRVRLLKTIYSEAQKQSLDPQLVLAVMDIESNFNRHAISKADARGLMQIMPFWRNEFGQPNADLFNPLVSVEYGCKILRRYIDRYNNIDRALAAYNGSLGRTIYSDKVLKRLKSHWQYRQDAYDTNSEIEMALSRIQ